MYLGLVTEYSLAETTLWHKANDRYWNRFHCCILSFNFFTKHTSSLLNMSSKKAPQGEVLHIPNFWVFWTQFLFQFLFKIVTFRQTISMCPCKNISIETAEYSISGNQSTTAISPFAYCRLITSIINFPNLTGSLPSPSLTTLAPSRDSLAVLRHSKCSDLYIIFCVLQLICFYSDFPLKDAEAEQVGMSEKDS